MKTKAAVLLLILVTGSLSAQPTAAGTSSLPKIAELSGLVSRYDEKSASFIPVRVGQSISEPTLLLTAAGAELMIAFPTQIVARFGENTQAVVGPEQDGRIEVDLQLGTLTALLDPERKKEGAPTFAIRGSGGVTEATGTFYAVTEYKGQTYTSVKKGEVKKETTPPAKPDFAAYLKRAKSKSGSEKSSRSE